MPTGYRVEAAYAIGRKGDPASLPDPLRAREAPNDRKPLGELAFEGGFPASASSETLTHAIAGSTSLSKGAPQ